MNLLEYQVTGQVTYSVYVSYDSENDSFCGFADLPDPTEYKRAFQSFSQVSSVVKDLSPTAQCIGLENIFYKVHFICNKMRGLVFFVQWQLRPHMKSNVN
jgi:hypothetical protein